MTTATFRHHHDAPAYVSSPLYRQLLQEWVDLNSQPTVPTTLRRWARTEPVLGGFTTLGDLVDAIDAAGHERTDALLLALVRLAHGGHQLAGRTVLQAMLPKLACIARRTAPTSSDDVWAEDRRHIVVAEFWDVLATYPLQRRPARVAANLALDTLQRVNRSGASRAEIPVDPATMTDSPEGDHSEPACEGLSSDDDLLQVINWARANGTLTTEEAELLRCIYTAPSGRNGSYGFEQAALQLGISPAAVRQRCSRAVRRLTAAVRDELGVDALTSHAA